MRWHPNTWGVGLHEFNPHHEPAGSPKGGGRFAHKPGSLGYGSKTRVAKALTRDLEKRKAQAKADAKAAQMRPDPRLMRDQPALFVRSYPPELPEEGSFYKERPKPKKARGSSGNADVVRRVQDHADEGVASALGIDDPGELARAMLSQVTLEKFRVSISSEGEAGEEPSGPDPSDRHVKRAYERWQEQESERLVEEAYDSATSDYLRRVETGVEDKLAPVYARVAAEFQAAHPELVSNEPESGDFHDLALEHFLGEEGEGDALFNEEGFINNYSVGREARIEAAARALLTAAVEQHTAFPNTLDGFSRLEIAARSKYFNDDDGRSNWSDDGQDSGALDDMDSFDSWYESEYGVSTDDWDSGGDSGEVDLDNANLTIEYNGDSGTNIKRVFSWKDGELHVHHDYFKAASGDSGLGKELFAGSIPAYEKAGVGSISVYANCDIGGYAWARYGFVPENPSELRGKVRSSLSSFSDAGLLTPAEYKKAASIFDAGEPTDVWEFADTRIFVGKDRAQRIYSALRDDPSNHHPLKKYHEDPETWNRLLQEDTDKGVVNIGRLILSRFSWSGELSLSDADARQRLRGYLGG